VPVQANLPATPVPPVISGPPPSRRELAERAWKLHELHNSLASIQAALESSGGTLEDVGIVMAKLAALERARREQFQRNLRWVLAGGLAVVFVLLVIAILLTSLVSPTSPASATVPLGTAAAGTGAAAASPAPGTPSPGGTPAAPTPTLVYNPIIALINQVLPGNVKIANGPSPTPVPTPPG
jgi:hypothetical protein